MGVKLEAGQWYRTREGEIVHCVGRMRKETDYPWLVQRECGAVLSCMESGRFFSQSHDQLDIIEHLPDCTGFDWDPPKPEPKYRPFANAEEWKRHRGRWVVDKDNYLYAIIGTTEEKVEVFLSWYAWKDAMEMFTFEDGTPFGVRVDD